jgi:hypothetical protein
MSEKLRFLGMDVHAETDETNDNNKPIDCAG